jgi:FkbM family methyltransferase
MLAFDQPLGRAMRWPLRLVPKSAVMPILSGPNRGLRWIVGSGTHGCWMGTYERENARLLASLCRPNMTVFDVGANAGYFTLLMARLTRRVLAFEPEQRNSLCLRRHAALNRMSNIDVVEAAVSDARGSASFGGSGFMGRLASDGARRVRTVRLDDYPTPYLIKMDIEGHELAALEGAQRILAERRTVWFVETHATDPAPIFQRFGYSVRQVGSHHIMAQPA